MGVQQAKTAKRRSLAKDGVLPTTTDAGDVSYRHFAALKDASEAETYPLILGNIAGCKKFETLSALSSPI